MLCIVMSKTNSRKYSAKKSYQFILEKKFFLLYCSEKKNTPSDVKIMKIGW